MMDSPGYKFLLQHLFLLALTSSLFYCTESFKTEVAPGELTEEQKTWLNDGDGDGEADSIAKYASDCDLAILECVEIARENKIIQEQKIADSLFLPVPTISLPGGIYHQTIILLLMALFQNSMLWILKMM